MSCISCTKCTHVRSTLRNGQSLRSTAVTGINCRNCRNWFFKTNKIYLLTYDTFLFSTGRIIYPNCKTYRSSWSVSTDRNFYLFSNNCFKNIFRNDGISTATCGGISVTKRLFSRTRISRVPLHPIHSTLFGSILHSWTVRVKITHFALFYLLYNIITVYNIVEYSIILILNII